MRLSIIFLSVCSIILLVYCSNQAADTIDSKVKSLLRQDFDAFQDHIQNVLILAAESAKEEQLQQAFLESRKRYKKLEWVIEYYAPGASRLLNGPPLPEIEIEETKVFPPAGLQVIEEHLYPFEEDNRQELIREVKVFLANSKHARNIVDQIEFTEAHVLDASKLEVFRMISLGLSGFDTPLSNTAISELNYALAGIDQVLELVDDRSNIKQLIRQASNYISKNSDFEQFDRMTFIRAYANPLSREIARWQKELKAEPLATLAIKNEAETLFDQGIFKQDFFADSKESAYSDVKAKLGRDLFSDPILSGSVRTCQTCHNPERAFSDGLPKSKAFSSGKFVNRNAPSLLYAGLQQAQFYDMRSPSLENQALDVIGNKDEMHASVDEAAARMNKIVDYKRRFVKAFPAMGDTIKPRYVMIALATYVRSLSPFNSRFDLHMRGDAAKLSSAEVKGFNLFMGKGKCGTCHFLPLFNGTVPPAFTSTESEVLGVPVKPKSLSIDPDLGRYAHNKIAELKHSFKTPTLRNVEKSAPYMHNGSFKTLEQVMEFYNEGGGLGAGLQVPNQTLSADPLQLSKAEQRSIIAFMNALTDI